jgi:hypothetical protein
LRLAILLDRGEPDEAEEDVESPKSDWDEPETEKVDHKIAKNVIATPIKTLVPLDPFWKGPLQPISSGSELIALKTK